MPPACRICSNSRGNRVHEVREMMFGTRDTFEYVECASCGTVHILEIPDLAPYYPEDYYSFDETPRTAASVMRRLAAPFTGRYLMTGKGLIGKALLALEPHLGSHFPPSLQEPILDLRFDSRILDFGCGRGHLLQILGELGFQNLTGADAFIEGDIEYPNGIKVYKKGLDELSPSFDLVMMNHSFEHMGAPLDELVKVRRLLAENGHCLVRIPVVNAAWERYGVNWSGLDAPRHLYLYTPKSFEMLANQAGFELELTVFDSEDFQFWTSEQYQKDIPLLDPRSYWNDKHAFSKEQIAAWKAEAIRLNMSGRGDWACFYLRKR